MYRLLRQVSSVFGLTGENVMPGIKMLQKAKKPMREGAMKFKRSILGSMILALTMTVGSMSAHAALVSYNVLYDTTSNGDTNLDVTFFIDDADIPATGTNFLLLSSVDVIFNGPFTFNVDQFFTYTNTDVSPCTFNCGSGGFLHVPFTAEFTNGNLTGGFRGVQPGPGGIGVARMSFFFIAAGNTANIMFFASAPTKFNTEVDLALQIRSSISGPFPVDPAVIPLPAALPLFLTGLAGLALIRRRRRQA